MLHQPIKRKLRHRVFLFSFIFSILILFPSLVGAQTETASAIELYIGDIKTLDFVGETAFVENEDIIHLTKETSGQITITAYAAGSTQIIYWLNDAIKYLPVTVLLPTIRETSSIGPTFRQGRFYLIYDIQHSFGFNQDNFFSSPFNFHTLTGYTPFFGNSSLRTFVDYAHEGADFKEGVINQALIHFNAGSTELLMGSVSPQLSSVTSPLSSAGLLGGLLKFKLSEGTTSQNLEFYGGISEPENYREIGMDDQLYGMHYTLYHYNQDTRYPNYMDINFFGYEPFEADDITLGGSLGSNLNISRHLSSKSSYVHGEDGFAFDINPLYYSDLTQIEGQYTYVNAGFQGYQTELQESDEHQAELSIQQLLKDNITTLQLSTGYELVLPKIAGSEDIKSQAMTSQLQAIRQLSYKKNYGLTHSIGYTESETETALSNSTVAAWTHPLSNLTYMDHSLGYSRGDLADGFNSITVANSFNLETTKLSYNAILDYIFLRGNSDVNALSLNQTATFSLERGTLGGSLSYTIPELSEFSEQTVSLATTLNYYLTSVDYITVTDSLSYLVSAHSSISGGIGLAYKRYLGPGVNSDSIFKNIFSGVGQSEIEGHVFIDKNYNNYLDEGDQPVEGVQVRIDKKYKTVTNEKGFFVFKKVKKGDHKLMLDSDTIDADQEISVINKIAFTSGATKKTSFPIPIHIKKASIRVLFVIDRNNNQQYDEEDEILGLPYFMVTSLKGETRKVYTGRGNSGIAQGLELGSYNIHYDPMELPEGFQALSTYNKQVSITKKNQEMEISFFFKPNRYIKGQIVPDGEGKLPAGLVVRFGEKKSQVDSEGYYSVSDIPLGNQIFEIQNLPQGYCLEPSPPKHVNVVGNAFSMEQHYKLTQNCSDP